MEQCTAYATFAKNGVYSPPFYVNEVRNPDGFLTYEGAPETEPNALPPNVAYVVTHMMEGVARWGTGARTAPLGDRPRAGKTGTTNENRDVWFCGFTRDYTCVVWMGYRDNRSLGQGSNYTGGRLACPVWTDFMLVAHEDLPMRDFEVPEGVTFYSVDRHSGLAGGGFREAFMTGTEPPVSRPVLPDAQMLEELMSDELLVDLDPGASPEDAPAVSAEPLPEPSPLADL
jgi:penicillin-binding protein 1A